MKYLCRCQYCGYEWLQVFWAKPGKLICAKDGCGDSKIDVISSEDMDSDPFGYEEG